jgi:DNA-binding NarL/FixJ family response regulator
MSAEILDMEIGTMGVMSASKAEDIRVLLADSQAIYRVGMRKVFALERGIRVVAQTESLDTVYAALERYATDVVLLEARLLGGSYDAITEFMRRAPETKLIVQVAETDEANMVKLYRMGVRGVVPRSITPDMLIKCVRKVAAGETWIDNQSVSWVIDAYRAHATHPAGLKTQPKFSEKELSIIACITRGMRNKEIAHEIGTSEQVIKNYLRKIYEKLGVSDRLELALYSLQHQVLKQAQASADADNASAGSSSKTIL